MKLNIPVVNSDKSEKFWIKVREIDANFSRNEKAHRHTYEKLIWVRSGTGKQIIDAEIIEIKRNTLYLISHGQVHNFLEGKDLDAILIVFDNNFLKTYPPFHFYILEKLLKNFKTYNTISLDEKISKEIDTVIRLMLSESKKPANLFGKFDLLNSFLLILLTSIERYVSELKPIKKPIASNYKLAAYQAYIQLVDLNFTKQHDLAFYAKKLGVSSRSLTDYSKTYAGKPAKQMITARIILEAKRLLTHTAKSLDEIAQELGFEESSYFIRLFRLKVGLTPRKYRLQSLE